MGRRERCDKATINIAPGWLSVQQDNRTSSALVYIMLLKARRRAVPRRVGPGAVERLISLDHWVLRRFPRPGYKFRPHFSLAFFVASANVPGALMWRRRKPPPRRICCHWWPESERKCRPNEAAQ